MADGATARSYEAMLRDVLEALGRSAGPDLFDRLLAAIGRVLEADLALIGRVDAGAAAVDSIAVWDGTDSPTPFRYALAGTPCADVAAGSAVVHPAGVAGAFPDDAVLRDKGIEGYAGSAITGRDGAVVAVLVVLSRRPFAQPSLVAALLAVFAARAGVELEAIDAQARLTRTNEALRQALAARAASEARLHDFAQASSDWFWEQDADLRFTYISEGLRHVTGIDPTRILGKTREDLRTEGTFHNVDTGWGDLSRIVAARAPFRDIVYAHRHANGKTLKLRISGVPVFDRTGAFLGYRGTGRDVTALHEAHARAARTQ